MHRNGTSSQRARLVRWCVQVDRSLLKVARDRYHQVVGRSDEHPHQPEDIETIHLDRCTFSIACVQVFLHETTACGSPNLPPARCPFVRPAGVLRWRRVFGSARHGLLTSLLSSALPRCRLAAKRGRGCAIQHAHRSRGGDKCSTLPDHGGLSSWAWSISQMQHAGQEG